MLGASKGKAFSPRISTHKISDNTEITLIEPPCGSNTIVIRSNGRVLFADSGYACYRDEIIASPKTALCLKNEYLGNDGYREKNPLHKPYINICKILTSYAAADPERITVIGKAIIGRLGVEKWQMFGARGFKKDYSVSS